MKLTNFLRNRTAKGQNEPMQAPRMRRAVIALGGGGARGLAHLGAIQAIGEAGIRIERFVGVSLGAMVGAMCAAEPSAPKVQAQALEFLSSEAFSRDQRRLFGSTKQPMDDSQSTLIAWYNRVKHLYSAHRRLTRAATTRSLLPSELLAAAVDALIPDRQFSDLPRSLSIVAVDLRSGHRVVIENGSVRQAVLASMAIPGIFPPVDIDGMLLADIGVIDSLPSIVAKTYASDLSIAVDVGQYPNRVEDCTTALDVMMRMQDIGERMMRREKREASDIVICPQLDSIEWFDFRKPLWIIERGHAAAHQKLKAWRAETRRPLETRRPPP
ncbi:NTE family protein RssA [Novipirellula aureliae]|uniref:NTE family protein RssA n=1 Tax=Novipirellula aureliae TaxID=2527966 RepID=A0A5C6DS01_9BACT|nr:patatin-like phospholipase family protein [Novipirellula aureliae]TWU37816.1 NTE family protein RssA [Novipirellula aureliae]